MEDQKFLEDLVKALVNNPADVRVERKVDERGVLLTLYVNPSDMGYVIGRSGQTAEAIRRLVRTVGAKNNARVNVRIYEPEGSRGPRQHADDQAPSSMPDEVDTSAIDDFTI